jgi:ankyrin repeat protein
MTSPNVEAASQALFADKLYSGRRTSQRIPKQTTGMHLAAYFQLDEAIPTLLLKGHDPDARDSLGQTPLSYAADVGYDNGLRILLKCDEIDCNSQDIEGMSALMWATSSGHETTVIILINDKRVNINSRDVEGRTPLLWAARNKHWNCLPHLLDKGADATSRDEFGQTALLFAAESGPSYIIEDLLSRDGVEADTKDLCHLTPLQVATAFARPQVVEQLLRKLSIDYTVPRLNINRQRRIINEARHLNHELPSHILLVHIIDNDIVSNTGLIQISSRTLINTEPMAGSNFRTPYVYPSTRVRFCRLNSLDK